MIQANELRLGNLVLDGEEPIKMDIASLRYMVDNKGIEIFLPIPLTEEWLLKLGFMKDKGRDSYYVDIENGYNKFDLMFFNGVVYLKSRYDGENLDTQSIPYIKYVHQLQNLYFALTGEELEVKS